MERSEIRGAWFSAVHPDALRCIRATLASSVQDPLRCRTAMRLRGRRGSRRRPRRRWPTLCVRASAIEAWSAPTRTRTTIQRSRATRTGKTARMLERREGSSSCPTIWSRLDGRDRATQSDCSRVARVNVRPLSWTLRCPGRREPEPDEPVSVGMHRMLAALEGPVRPLRAPTLETAATRWFDASYPRKSSARPSPVRGEDSARMPSGGAFFFFDVLNTVI